MKSVHCIHYVVSKNFATEPVDDSNHKCPEPAYRHISNVRAPGLIRMLYLDIYTGDAGYSHVQDEARFPMGQNADEDRTSAEERNSIILSGARVISGV